MYTVSTSGFDDHKFKKEELETVGELSDVCSQIVLKCLHLARSTTVLRHFDQEERQPDGSRNWDLIKPVLMRKFVCEGARDFGDEAWLQKIFEGNTKKN